MRSDKRDYEAFIKWVHSPEIQAASNVRRLANLVLANFDAIAETSSNRSKRSILLASLAQQSLAGTPDTQPEIVSVAATMTWPWVRLRELTVGPFRGFRISEPFDLQNRLVLFYGPNGSGKTSLCEALEYALLGSVGEAEAKRMTDSVYLPNIHEGKFDPPILKAVNHDGNEILVAPNDTIFRFCFIEKNRIDSFSRLAAKPPAQRNELIATLFGMDQFNDFVGNFNDSIENQLVLRTPNQEALKIKRASLVQDQTAVASEADALQSLDMEELALAISYAEGTSYEALKSLIGRDDAPARLKELNGILDTIPPVVLDVTRDELLGLYEAANAAQIQLDKLTAELVSKADQVSFKELYSSVLALKSVSEDRCPACDTPLTGPVKVLSNPFEKATSGLLHLADLASLQESQKKARSSVEQAATALRTKLDVLSQFLIINGEQNTAVFDYLHTLPTQISTAWWKSVYETNADLEPGLSILEAVLKIADRIELQDNSAKTAMEQRQKNINERDRLLRYQLLVQAQENKRSLFQQNMLEAKKRIERFDEENAELIKLAAQEFADNERDKPLKEAYDQFLNLLRQYLGNLPGTLIAGLNEQAMSLYNEFNRDDRDTDRLSALHLPVTGDQKIEISFCGNPHVRVDALKILSEGHVRCLGLAILLAKNLHLGSPLIVFDDAINAIDHDHRRGIRETIFQSDRFSGTQIIVTCHSNEFINDIQQNLTKEVRKDTRQYLLLNHEGNYHPKIKRDIPSRNYVDMARTARNERNDRAALDASRKALEILTEKIWRWLAKYDHGTIKVLLTGVGAEPALRNLCEALRTKIAKANTFTHKDKDGVLAALDRVLGLSESNLIWTYLNKGTHAESDRDDFEGAEVESVVQTLEELEKLALAS